MTLLDEAARGLGVTSQDAREADGLLRRLGVLFHLESGLFPALSLEAVRLFFKQETVPIHLHPGANRDSRFADTGIRGIDLGPVFRPLSPQGRVWSHFRPFQEGRYLSVLSLLNNEVPPELVDGHIVFIGTTAQGLESHIGTPLGEQVPNVELHLQLAEQLIEGNYLLRPAWENGFISLFLILAWSGLLPMLWMGHPRFSSLWALLVTSAISLFCWRLFLDAHLFLDPLYPILVVTLLFLTLIIARYLEGERERRLVAARSSFLAHVSHEIRTPLNAVLGLTRLCLGTVLNDRQRDYLVKIEASGENLLGIINDILDFSKMDAGMMSLESISFPLDEMLDHVAVVTAVKTREKGLELLFSRPGGIPGRLVGDPLRLGQILINLLGNAVKFTEVGEILLSIRERARQEDHIILEFSIRDSGIGMTPEQMGRLFKAFSQADDTTTRKFGGTGLGLTISKQLVEMMNGEIGVDSQPGIGSTFHFTVRFDGYEADADPMPWPETVTNKRALVVEGGATAREILDDLLRDRGLPVETLDNADDGLQRLIDAAGSGQPFDLLFLEWKNTDAAARETLRRIRRHPQIEPTPKIILVTARGRESVQNDVQGLKPDDILSKPVTGTQLSAVILKACGLEREAGPAAPTPGKEELDDIRGARVLIVDDNEINQQVAAELLGQARLSVTIAGNGREAVDRVFTQPFDCVLMDVQMPILDGYEATRIIRRESRFKDLPIIAMTANAMADNRDKYRQVGIDDHVSKPIDPQSLYRVLTRWIVPGDRQPATVATEAAETAPSDEPPLPDLPGIDRRAGLNRLGGNLKGYKRLLLKFYDNQSRAGADIRSALESGDIDKTIKLVHTLKGVSGNIGAETLHQTAKQLESLLKEGGDTDKVAALVARINGGLDSVLAGIDELREHPPEPVTVSTVIDGETIKPLLRNLKTVLEANSFDTADAMEALAESLKDAERRADMNDLRAAVSNYDFDRALIILDRITTSLNVVLDDS